MAFMENDILILINLYILSPCSCMPARSSDVTSPLYLTKSELYGVELWPEKHYTKITFALVDIKWMISSFYPIRYLSSWAMTKNVFIKSQ